MAVGERLVAYERVSTARQGLSGLGLEAQRKAIGDFASARGAEVLARFAAPPNGSSVWVRVVDEVSGAVFEQEITADLPAATQFLSPRLFMNTGATAAAVAFDCAGGYVETDF